MAEELDAPVVLNDRFEAALWAQGSNLTLGQTARMLVRAVFEAEMDGVDPHTDPAVMLLGIQISFMTHADLNTELNMEQLMKSCATSKAAAVITPLNPH